MILNIYLFEGYLNKNYYRILLCLIIMVFSFVACGKRGTPEPPSLVVPVKVDDLRVDMTPGKRQLVWTIPTLNADNSKPVDLKAFKVLLKKLPMDQDSCRYCDEGFSDYLDISLKNPVQGSIIGSSFYLPLPQISFDSVYIFSVSSLNSRGWISQVSNKLAVFYLPQVLPPSGLDCNPSASIVELTWHPPLLPPHYSGSLMYRVYRRGSQGVDRNWQLVTPEPLNTPEFIDVGLVDWGSYEYVVTALVSQDESFYESDFSASTLVVPGDYTPPAQLVGFTVFYYQGGIQLVWDRSPEADLSGYRVYRRDNVSGIDQLLTVLSPQQHEFFDTDIIFKRTYFYRVTAFDHSDRINESLPTPELSVVVK